MAPAHPSLQFHKLDKAKDPRFWSVRVRADLRLIIHRSETSLLLCYVDHHDKAYQWGERRKVGDTPEDGSGAIGGDPGDGGEIQVGKYVEAAVQSRAKPLLFAHLGDEELLSVGVPAEWLAVET